MWDGILVVANIAISIIFAVAMWAAFWDDVPTDFLGWILAWSVQVTLVANIYALSMPGIRRWIVEVFS